MKVLVGSVVVIAVFIFKVTYSETRYSKTLYDPWNEYSLAKRSDQLDIWHDQVERNSRFFGIGIVRFENSICAASDGLNGTCYTRRQCTNINGVASGRCASNIGVCCVVFATCGDTALYNNTYFVSPNYPNTFDTATSCTLTIRKCNAGICQIRIDLLSFSLAQPDGNGYCIFDAMYVLGGASTVPVICGENSGQHLYVDFNGDNDIQIVISTTSALSQARNWFLRIAQIECNNPSRAPSGCLMYYTALTGTVRSFNYGSTVSSAILNFNGTNFPGTRELANLNYGVCIQMVPGYCAIQWSQSAGDPYSFSVSGDTVGLSVDPGLPTGALINGACLDDFVVIPNPFYPNGTAVGSDRFCGNQFNTVTTGSKPFVLTVVTNSTQINMTTDITMQNVGNRGFSLMYNQLSCGTTLVNNPLIVG
ncbi:uncharacterized protein LOC108742105 [Agrilus planipennis]|uniref:Uncharacterized protein LOC108742105 n=1 Tax=Agrilus planipennis TaxID=224129 RepID=A0A1W4X947_AGRPL|nr:uncharacterized protein LOC108742105 [Agrilus planipennis]